MYYVRYTSVLYYVVRRYFSRNHYYIIVVNFIYACTYRRPPIHAACYKGKNTVTNTWSTVKERAWKSEREWERENVRVSEGQWKKQSDFFSFFFRFCYRIIGVLYVLYLFLRNPEAEMSLNVSRPIRVRCIYIFFILIIRNIITWFWCFRRFQGDFYSYAFDPRVFRWP